MNWQERAEKAEAELARLLEQKPALYMAFSDCGNFIRYWTRDTKNLEATMAVNDFEVLEFYADPVTAPAVTEEWLKCWLIERPASSEWPATWLTITTDDRRWVSDGGTMYATGGDWYFTSAASEALKFADKESADEYVRHNKIKDVVVTEHIFDNRAMLQSAPQAPDAAADRLLEKNRE